MKQIRPVREMSTSFLIGLLITALLALPAFNRTMPGPNQSVTPINKISSDAPYVSFAVHDINRFGVTITNQGNFGTGFIGSDLTGNAPSGDYPYPGRTKYQYGGAFWIGAVVGRDTLVSVGADGWQYTREMWPDPYPKGEIVHHSILDPEDKQAISEQDYIAIYTDTVTDPSYVPTDPKDGRPHIPLNIEITQRSYAWSYAYAEDFILFDYSIKNIGNKTLKNVYMGIYLDDEVTTQSGSIPDFIDDICGFKEYVNSWTGCGFIDTINIAWSSDNDGRPGIPVPCPSGFNLTSATGIRVIRTPSDSLLYSFNWWISNGDAFLDFGPRRIGTPDVPFRDFGGYLGTPEGDKNKYYMMRHEEFDYDQLFSAKDHSASGWLPPPPEATDFADGFDNRFLLSFGPFNIDPGEILPVSFADVAGENFHTQCDAFDRLFKPDPTSPEDYYNYLNFSDLAKNAVWASWIYDNPGYDTDGDLNKGKYRICVYDSLLQFDTISVEPLVIDTSVQYTKADTMWYQGDGVPDFRGASPPPPPHIRIIPKVDEYNQGELRIRWNGLVSETTKDLFSNLADFEGYRVYLSSSPNTSEFALIASFDKEDYNRFIWSRSRSLWELREPPFTLDSLRVLYGDDFQPLDHDRDNIFTWYDSAFYFVRQDWNQSNLLDSSLIHKVYPDEPRPTTLNPDSAAFYYPDQLTEDGDFKYYEYEYILRHLLPSQLYYVSVTAFDYGSPSSGLESLESSFSANVQTEYAQNQTGVVEDRNLKVVVYPNPYRIDAGYRSREGGGFEGRGQEAASDDRVRAVHFTNLPHKCTIRIFSIDGDLIREIRHDFAPNDPRSMHDTWDLITRNTQEPVSGIYYYSVESEFGSQIGKIVIIM